MHGLVRQFTAPEAYSAVPFPFVIPMPKQRPLWAVASLRYLTNKRLILITYWSNKPIVVKLFFAKKRAKNNFLSELHGLQTMYQRKITTPPILYADETVWPESYMIITGFLLGAKTYNACFQDLSFRQYYAESFIHMLQRMHALGMLQKDLHGGNFLYWQQQWYCLDGDGVSFRRKSSYMSRKKVVDNDARVFLSQLDKIRYYQFDLLFKRAIEKQQQQWLNDLCGVPAAYNMFSHAVST